MDTQKDFASTGAGSCLSTRAANKVSIGGSVRRTGYGPHFSDFIHMLANKSFTQLQGILHVRQAAARTLLSATSTEDMRSMVS